MAKLKTYKGAKAKADKHDLMQSKGNKPRTGVVKKCPICASEFYMSPYYTQLKKYCSKKCYDKGQTKKKPMACIICGTFKDIQPSQLSYGRKYCSYKCAHKGQKPKKIGTRRKGLLARVAVLSKRYARLRDCGGIYGTAQCISCDQVKPFSELDGGHFIPSTCSYWKFDERNINAQCQKCNRFLHGNARHYQKGMLRKYGQKVLDELEKYEFTSKKWTYEELSQLYDYYKLKIEELEGKQ